MPPTIGGGAFGTPGIGGAAGWGDGGEGTEGKGGAALGTGAGANVGLPPFKLLIGIPRILPRFLPIPNLQCETRQQIHIGNPKEYNNQRKDC